MVVLASALLLRDKRYFFKEYPRLKWGPAQIANEVIRVKSRLLLDFFYPRRPKADDMVADDFGVGGSIKALDPDTADRLKEFRERVNKWSVHLSWERTVGLESSKSDRERIEQYALDLLGVANKFIRECLCKGFELKGWAKSYYENFNRLYNLLVATARVEEGTAKLPAERICLEDLSV